MSFLPLLPSQQSTTTRYEPSAAAPAAFRPRPPLRPPPAAPLRWLLYREAQERALLVAAEAAASPLHCYGDPTARKDKEKDKGEDKEKDKSGPEWRFSRAPLVITTDAELGEMIDRAFGEVLQRIHGETEAQKKAAEALSELQREETKCRQGNIVEPWARGSYELSVFKEVVEGKVMIWNQYLRQLRVYQELLHLVQEEKRARIAMLGHFVSCKAPLPCRHLCWDMAVLEESGIPLEPEVNLVCLFTSIVISQQDMLHTFLLDQWKWELSLIKKQESLARNAFMISRCLRKNEMKAYNTLIAYHYFCILSHANQNRAQEIETQNRDDAKPAMTLLCKSEQGLSVRRSHPGAGSPILDYYTYLHIVETFHIECKLRKRIIMLELMDLSFLMNFHECAGRRVVAANEEKARQCVLSTMEQWARSNIVHQATEYLRTDLSSDTLFCRAHNARIVLCEQEKWKRVRLSAEAARTALLIFEHNRRGAFLLLELQLRTEMYQLLCRTDHMMDVRVVCRRMHKRERRILERDEKMRRATVAKNAEADIFAPSVAHAWVAEQHAASLSTLREVRLRRAAEQLFSEQQSLRTEIEALWQSEHNNLFAKKLCEPRRRICSMNMRQVILADLVDLLGDAPVFGVFA